MASLTTALATGASGIYTSQTAVQVTGNNIANVNTAGYSRQTANVVSAHPLTQGGLTFGTGSAVATIDRSGDSFIARQLIAQSATYGAYEAASTPLADIERILDIGDSSLSTDIDSFFDAWEELSTNPSGTAERQQVLQEAVDLADHFHLIDQQLTEVANSIDANVEAVIPDLNDQLQQIGDLNQSIMQTELAGGNANTLRDQRDLLVQEVSETCGATTFLDDNGMVCLQLPDGLPLVTGSVASSFATTKVDGRTEISLDSGSAPLSLNYQQFGGELRGMLEVRDTTIPTLRNEVDRLAYTLATDIDSLISTSGGIDRNGDPATDLFTLTSPTDPLADAWEGAAASIAVAFDDPDRIAAGSTSSTGDNSLCLAVAALRDTAAIDGATYSEEYARIAAKAGLLADGNDQQLSASTDLLDELNAKRDAACGVSTDEEMVLLIQYQAGYEAASRYIAVVKEMLDTLLTM